jgi:pheromone shutdown-related protein TraB
MPPEQLKIIGTAHVSQKSVEEVRNAITESKPDFVAVELCLTRYNNLMREKEGVEEDKKIQIRQLLKNNQFTLFLVSAFLSYIQRKIGDDVGVKPGAEMIEALEAGNEVGANMSLIDRDIQITLQRALNQMSIGEKMRFIYSIIASFFAKDEDIQDIESIKEGDTLKEVMEYFQKLSPKAYNVLVKERDAYMASMLLNLTGNVIAVVGAGHKEGIQHYMENPDEIPSIYELTQTKKSKISLSKVIIFSIPVLFIAIFLLAFLKGINIQTSILEFVLLTGGLAFLGSLIAGSKIPSAVTAFLVAPITSLHPLLAAGWFAGIVEAKIRGFSMEDLSDLGKCESFRELWSNRIFRILLVVMGANIGCSIGTFLSIPNVIFPLMNKLFGM